MGFRYRKRAQVNTHASLLTKPTLQAMYNRNARIMSSTALYTKKHFHVDSKVCNRESMVFFFYSQFMSKLKTTAQKPILE